MQDGNIGEGDLDDLHGEDDAEDEDRDGNGHQSVALSQSRILLVERCRRHSGSTWLYFPHMELLFLLFAFEGAVAAQASAIRTADCEEIVVAASIALVSYLRSGRLRPSCSFLHS